MNDPRLLPFIACLLASVYVAGVSIASHRYAKEIDQPGYSRAMGVLYILLWYGTAFPVAGWIDQTLWNMVMPQIFGLPQIDLLAALILGVLILSLVKGTAGIVDVRVVE
jgi:hypothetical protein